MSNYNILKNKFKIEEIEISGQGLYYGKIYGNCCLLNCVSILLTNNGNKIFKDDNIDDSIVLYQYLKQNNIKLYELGEAQQDNILENITEIFNTNICLYDKVNDIMSIYKKKNINNDYLSYIIIYVGGHFNLGKINIDKTLEEKLKIIKKLKINVIEIDK